MLYPAPSYEYADSSGDYYAERQAHDRREALAGHVILALTNACQTQGQRLPTRETHEAHLKQVAHFADKVRDYRSRNPEWRASQMFCRWLTGRGVLLDEVLAAAAEVPL